MAQAKTRAPTKRPSTRKRSTSTKSRKSQARKSQTHSQANGQARVKAARKAVESTAKDAGKTVSKAASKAKTPLLAGGAALAGAAGGMAIGAMRSRHAQSRKVLGMKMPQPKRVKLRSRDVARAAKEVGSFSQSVGELATELRHVREESGNGRGKHRSPVEVVLDGLTARR